MSLNIASKRLTKDIKLLDDNKDELASRGIYFYVNDINIFNVEFLIIPKQKKDVEDDTLISPYTGGFFIFKLVIPEDYPLSPPKATFYPQQNTIRLHPNYYENGNVCLSVTNTWGKEDWVPSISLLSLANVFEERLNERSLAFEPGKEMVSNIDLKRFNTLLKYAINKVAVLDVLMGKYGQTYKNFQECIWQHWRDHKEEYIGSLKDFVNLPVGDRYQQYYNHVLYVDFPKLLQELQGLG